MPFLTWVALFSTWARMVLLLLETRPSRADTVRVRVLHVFFSLARVAGRATGTRRRGLLGRVVVGRVSVSCKSGGRSCQTLLSVSVSSTQSESAASAGQISRVMTVWEEVGVATLVIETHSGGGEGLLRMGGEGGEL